MAKKGYYLRDRYEQWLKDQNKDSWNQYANKTHRYGDSDVTYFDLVAWFYFNDEQIYAFSLLNKWLAEKLEKDHSYSTYLETFRKFLLTIDKNSVEVPKPNIDLVAVRQSFKKTELHHLDGMDGLINELGEKGLVKLAIETSLFFHKDIVIERFDQMCSKRDEEDPLPARKSTQAEQNRNKKEGKQIGPDEEHPNELYPDDWIYLDDIQNPTFIYPIKRDENGNAPVCSIINKFTGYNLNVVLDDKPFKNYIISHIWSRAIDPRYFTSLWNIVLVPAWVNHLLDKNNTEDGSFSSRLKATFMRICIEYYELKKLDWASWGLQCPKECDEKPFNDGYQIQIINKSIDYNPNNERSYPTTVGKISQDSIRIK